MVVARAGLAAALLLAACGGAPFSAAGDYGADGGSPAPAADRSAVRAETDGRAPDPGPDAAAPEQAAQPAPDAQPAIDAAPAQPDVQPAQEAAADLPDAAPPPDAQPAPDAAPEAAPDPNCYFIAWPASCTQLTGLATGRAYDYLCSLGGLNVAACVKTGFTDPATHAHLAGYPPDGWCCP